MKSSNTQSRLLAILTVMAIILSYSGTLLAVDDGARA